MAQSSKAMHHFHKKRSKLYKNTIENLAFGVGIASPVVTLPQLVQVWALKNAQSLSLFTWLSYTIMVIIMTLYGVLHKEKPLIIMYGSLIIIDIMMVVGIILY